MDLYSKIIELIQENELRGEFTVLIQGNENKDNSKINYIEIKNDLENLIVPRIKKKFCCKLSFKKYGINKNSIYNLD